MEVEMNFWYDYHLQLNLIWNVKSTINNYLFYLLIAAMLQPFHFQKCYVLCSMRVGTMTDHFPFSCYYYSFYFCRIQSITWKLWRSPLPHLNNIISKYLICQLLLINYYLFMTYILAQCPLSKWKILFEGGNYTYNIRN